jgi:hypothetical protein
VDSEVLEFQRLSWGSVGFAQKVVPWWFFMVKMGLHGLKNRQNETKNPR